MFIVLMVISLTHSNAQDLVRENGGTSWQSTSGGQVANVGARQSVVTTIASNIVTTIIFTSEEYDVNNTFDPVTGIFTPPQAGYYVINASISWGHANTLPGIRSIRLVKNGSTIVEKRDEDGSGYMHSSIHTLIYSDGTDNYRIQAYQTSGLGHSIGSTGGNLGGSTRFTAFSLSEHEVLKKQGGGLSWDNAFTRIRAVRTTSTTIAFGNTSDLTYDSEDFDVNNDFNHSTGVFTPPAPGYYVILASALWDGNGNTGTRAIQLYKNGSTITDQNCEDGSGVMSSSMHTIIYSDGSDNYRLRAWQNSGLSQNIVEASFAAFRIMDVEGVVSLRQGGAMIGNLINGKPTRVRAKRNASMNVISSQVTRVGYSEDFDVNGEFNLNPSTAMFAPVQAGYYAVMATLNWGSGNTSLGERGVYLTKRDPPLYSGGAVVASSFERGSGQMTSSLHTVVYYNGTSSHRFTIDAYQNSGSGHNIGPTAIGVPGCILVIYKL